MSIYMKSLIPFSFILILSIVYKYIYLISSQDVIDDIIIAFTFFKV